MGRTMKKETKVVIPIIIISLLILIAIIGYRIVTYEVEEDLLHDGKVHLVVSTDKDTYSRGEEVQITIELINGIDKELAIHKGDGGPSVGLRLVNEDGSAVFSATGRGVLYSAVYVNWTLGHNSKETLWENTWGQEVEIHGFDENPINIAEGTQVPKGEYFFEPNLRCSFEPSVDLSYKNATIRIK